MNPQDKAQEVLRAKQFDGVTMLGALAQEHPQIFLKLAAKFKT